MNVTIATILTITLVGWSAEAGARGKYRVTASERAACEGDAKNLCGGTYPDQDALLSCMKVNVSKLTSGCRPVFIEGLRRRGID